MKYIIYTISIVLLGFACTDGNESISSQETVVSKKSYKWIDFEYDSALVFLYGIEKEDTSGNRFPDLIISNDSLNPSVVDIKGTRLTASQITTININMSSSQKASMVADCFDPHHGIVFYKNDSIVGHISICFMCNNLRSYPKPKNGLIEVGKLSRVIKDLGLPVFQSLDDIDTYKENM